MKKLYLKILYIFIFLISLSTLGQGIINNHWQLGQVDLNFTNPTPLASTISNGNGGLTFISDDLGNLLFYTNGVVVWNKNHTVMQNGSALMNIGSYSIVNSIIVPNPANNNQYYIFTSFYLTPSNYSPFNTYYSYSIVDFTNNVLGSVKDLNNFEFSSYGLNQYSKAFTIPSSTNILIENRYYYGPLTVTKDANNEAYWLILQDKNKLLSYKIDNSGLNLTPIESIFSNYQIYTPGQWDAQNSSVYGRQNSKIRMTPDNTRLIGLEIPRLNVSDPLYSYSGFYKLDFNPTTGAFSNFQSLLGSYRVYDFEISNNYQNIYLLRNSLAQVNQTINGEVLVKDINNPSTPLRSLNIYGTSTTSSGFSSIQKDRNGNILLSSNSSINNANKYIHKIEDQDNFSTSSVLSNFVYLNNITLGGIFPQLIPQLSTLNQNCQSLTLNTEPNTGIFTYQDYSDITTDVNYIINLSSQDITMKARDFIILKPNTHIVTGSKFLAKIENCSSGRFANYYIDESDNLENNFIDSSSKVKIYPNPSNSYVTFESVGYTITNVTITSTEGFQVFDSRIDNTNSYQLDVSFLRKGIYIVTFKTKEGNTFVEKLIKK
ncbi:T9SS type A sorting domain-containing protein [Flavobacterium ponti]|uniref:T9SS type A sorting domain-containing protein n=1 Tax=Flavobacterium ponti TaxID=665133 RepID=A0ABV9P5U0_9FLAO